MSEANATRSSGESAQATERGLLVSRVGRTIVVSVDGEPMPDGLSESEVEIARAVLLGRTNKQIADARGSSAKTVANQLGSIYRKLGVHSRYGLAAALVGEDPAQPDREP